MRTFHYRPSPQQRNDSDRRGARGSVQSTEEIRKGILAEIRTYAKEDNSIDLLAHFNDRLKKCSLDLKERHQTLLHWIVAQVETQDRMANDANEFLDAAQSMVDIAMRSNKKLISQVDQAGNTALHHALSSTDDRVTSLITAMCSHEGSQEHLREAIAHKNNNGENCLHLAIEQASDIAEKLIPIADEAAFCQRRSSEAKHIGQALPNTGNTPLHDAVKYDRGVMDKPICADKSPDGKPCNSCQEDIGGYQYKVANTTMLVTTLISRCNKALKVKNDNDESPYLYFLRTKAEYESAEREKVQARHSKESTTCHQRASDEASTSIESRLVESAFIVGGFKDACACFFGDKADEEGRSSPLRPGYPIIETSHLKYKRFVPENTDVLSHVDLQIGRPTASRTENPAIQGGGSSISTQQEAKTSNEDGKDRSIRQWKKDMISLTKIFAMLRDRGVKRILKVTIRDNQKRPCSDQVVQKCLAGFDVRYLNWNKPDLSASIICASCPRIAELTLYSSGRRAVLDSWLSNTGLRRLRQLTHVHLEAATGLEEYDVYKGLIDSFQTELIENIQLTRRKLILASLLEMCKLNIQVCKGYIQDWATLSERAKDRIEYEKYLEEDEKKYEIYEEGLSQLERQGANLEDRLLAYSPGNPGGDTTAAAHAISQNGTKDGGEDKKSNSGNGTSSAVGNQLSDAKATNPVTVCDQSSYDPGSIETPTMHRKWRYSDQYDGGPTREVKLFKTTPDFEDYSAGSFVSLDFHMSINLEAPPSYDRGVVRTITNSDGTITHISTTLEQNRWLDAVRRFVEKWVQPTDNKPEEAIKVALIDDGIDIRQFENLVYHPGWPPAKPDSEEKLWYSSEKGHGTIMAKMIFDMCPRAHLFVAKLGGYDDPKRIENAERAADAIAWAIEKQVDIISMSWSLVSSDANKDGIAKLEKMIKKARDANILLYCAAADKGPFVEEDTLFPHSMSEIRIIGSAKETGGESHFVAPSQVHYLFPGENIPDLGNISGSSVATALASGFAALILWCFKYKKESVEPMTRHNGMDSLFKNLTQSHSKWVNVTSLLGIESPREIQIVVERCKSAVDWKVKGL